MLPFRVYCHIYPDGRVSIDDAAFKLVWAEDIDDARRIVKSLLTANKNLVKKLDFVLEQIVEDETETLAMFFIRHGGVIPRGVTLMPRENPFMRMIKRVLSIP